MNRKEILKREYEQKRAAGGFDGPVAPCPQTERRSPVRGLWKGKVAGFLVLAGIAAACWWLKPWRAASSGGGLADGLARTVAGRAANLPAPEPLDDESFAQTLESNAEFFRPNLAEYNQLCEYVRQAPCVTGNSRYAAIMDGVDYLLTTNLEINAYASFATRKDGEKEERVRVINFTAGSWFFCRLSSLAVAAGLEGDKGAVMRFVNSLDLRDYGNMDAECVVRLMRKARLDRAFASEAVRKRAKSLAAGMIVGILAHEVGHHVLGHVDGNEFHPDSAEVTRNQEREADSFASSVISSSPFGEYVFTGTLLWHYALANKQSERGAAEGDHPLSQERLENLIRANPDKAREMGIELGK